MSFARFMSGTAGRSIRIVAGLALIATGYAMHSTTGNVVALVGCVPLAAGALDLCFFAPLFGAPLSGKDIRRPS